MIAEDVVLLDAHGAAVGSAAKSAVHHRDTPLHLAFSCYLIDSSGQVLLTRRALTKATWPGVWTNSCCGHPVPGEKIVESVRRRLHQELGTSVRRVDLILPRFRYRAVMENGIVENEMCPVFRAWATADVDPDRQEVQEVRWRCWAEIAAMVRQADGRAPWFRAQVGKLNRLGMDPRQWPIGDAADLPSAAREPGMPPST